MNLYHVYDYTEDGDGAWFPTKPLAVAHVRTFYAHAYARGFLTLDKVEVAMPETRLGVCNILNRSTFALKRRPLNPWTGVPIKPKGKDNDRA